MRPIYIIGLGLISLMQICILILILPMNYLRTVMGSDHFGWCGGGVCPDLYCPNIILMLRIGAKLS